MIQHGTRPRLRKKTDYSYEHTFGSTFALPLELNLDAGLTMPDQVAMGMPNGCTGVTHADIRTDLEKVVFDPHYTYDKTRQMEGTYPQDVGCYIETAIKSTRVYGVRPASAANDNDALNHRNGLYFDVDRKGNDYFDAFRSAIYLNNRPLSVGSIWYPEWEPVGLGGGELLQDGILGMPRSLKLAGPWHSYKIAGWKLIGGVPYLLVKSWQGERFGDHGWAYMSREVCNAVFSVSGTQAFTIAEAKPEDIKLIQRSIIEVLIDLYARLIAFLSKKTAPMPSEPTPAPQPLPEPNKPLPGPMEHDDTYAGGSLDDRARMYYLAASTCDRLGLPFSLKRDLLLTIAGESGFNARCINHKTKDYGLCQFSAKYYLKEYKMTPEEALSNPGRCVEIMAKNFLAGRQSNWVAYKTRNSKRNIDMVAKLRAHYYALHGASTTPSS